MEGKPLKLSIDHFVEHEVRTRKFIGSGQIESDKLRFSGQNLAKSLDFLPLPIHYLGSCTPAWRGGARQGVGRIFRAIFHSEVAKRSCSVG